MKKIITLIYMFIIALFAKGQVFSDSLYLHLYNYSVITSDLDSGIEFKNLNKSFYIKELVDSINTDSFGIFKFYHLLCEDSPDAFFVLENEKVEIYDMLSFDILIEKVLDNPIAPEASKNLYIKEILKTRRKSFNTINRLVIQQQKDNYHYFIPIQRLKNRNGIFKE